jgi:hypothetical protein
MRFLAVVLSIAAMNALAPEPVYELTLDPSARDVDGRKLYISDDQLRAKIPALEDLGVRIETCVQSMTEPMSYNFTYAPTVTAPHEALTNGVQCEGSPDDRNVRCQADLWRTAVVFDGDPQYYFAFGPNTDRGAAMEVFRAFNQGRVVYSDETKPWIKGLKIREIAQQGSTFVVRKEDCGCTESVAIERRSEGGAVSFRLIRKPEGRCI